MGEDNFLDEEYDSLDLSELEDTGLNPVIPSTPTQPVPTEDADETSVIGPGNLEEPDESEFGENSVGIMNRSDERAEQTDSQETSVGEEEDSSSPSSFEYNEDGDMSLLQMDDDLDLSAFEDHTSIERQHPLEDFVHALDVEVQQDHIEHDEIMSYQVTPETLVAFADAILKEIDSASDELRAELNEAHRESQDGLAGARSDIEQARSLAEGASTKAHQAFQKANEPVSTPNPDRREATPAAAIKADEEGDVPAPKGRGRHNRPAKAKKGASKPAKVDDPGKRKTLVSGVGGLVIGILFFVVVVLVLGVVTGQPILSDLGLALPL
jgi:hypothetical protein